MGRRGLCRRLSVWTLGRERDGPQEGRGRKGREARWVRVRPQVLRKGPQYCAQPEVRMYLLWKRNGPWAALRGVPSYPKLMLGPEAPGKASKATPDQATEMTLTLGSLLAIQKEDSRWQRGVQLHKTDRQLRMKLKGFSRGGRQWAASSPFPALRLKWQPHPHPWVFAVMTTCHQPGRSFLKPPVPSAPLHR